MEQPLTPTSRPKRERKRLQTPNPEVRGRLMQAAADLIKEAGWPAVRIDEIAERAGLSVGTFYLYFDGKPDLFVQLVQDYTTQLGQRVAEASARATSVAESLVLGFDAYLDFVLENERTFLYFTRVAGTLETNAGALATWAFNRHASAALPGVEAAVASGEARRVSPVLASQAIVGLTQHMVVYWLEHRDACTREQLRDFVNGFIAFGLAAPPRPDGDR
jgi:AcrR family transcriptional regulator